MIKVEINSYHPRNKKEVLCKAEFLRIVDTGNYLKENNPCCHFVVDAFVINRERSKVLLIDHKLSGLSISPGGHLEKGESLLEGAMRELKEETGLSPVILNKNSIYDIQIGYVPASMSFKRNETPHLHYHICYAFEASESDELTFDDDGVSDVRWFSLSEVDKLKYRRIHISRIKNI